MKLVRAMVLFVCAMALAWLAGWGLPHDGLAFPAGVASLGALLLAVFP